MSAKGKKDNSAKLAQLQAMSASVRTGGKGTVRRKRKVVHKGPASDDKKLQGTLKRLGVQPITGIEEVNLFREDGNVVHFVNPKVQVAIHANTFVVSGPNETKTVKDLLPGILQHLGHENIRDLRNLVSQLGGDAGSKGKANDDDDEVPDLVPTDFEAAATNTDATTTATTPEPAPVATPEPEQPAKEKGGKKQKGKAAASPAASPAAGPAPTPKEEPTPAPVDTPAATPAPAAAEPAKEDGKKGKGKGKAAASPASGPAATPKEEPTPAPVDTPAAPAAEPAKEDGKKGKGKGKAAASPASGPAPTPAAAPKEDSTTKQQPAAAAPAPAPAPAAGKKKKGGK